MAKQSTGKKNDSRDVVVDLGRLNAKQIEFFNATTKFTCYGGAKGGGKSHAAQRLALKYGFDYEGVKILIIRAHYPELLQNHIEPMQKLLPSEMFSYNGSTHIMKLFNGSVIQFGHWSGDESENEYQGQSHDIIIMDEATQFSERTFRHLAGCLRGDNDFPKRFYLTCNPGGVGHFWVKRLFIDRKFKVDKEHPEKTERPDQYSFIFARAEDNTIMLERNPDYLSDISMMHNSDAMRYGDWNVLSGCYFANFDPMTHVVKRFKIPEHWNLYRSFDYGLDMFSCWWVAIDGDGRAWCYKHYEHSDLNVQDAAAAALNHTLPTEKVMITYAPPDMWSRQKDTGKTMAELFMMNGLPIVKSDNNRAQGHMIMRSMLEPISLNDPDVIEMYGGKDKAPKKLPALMFFSDLGSCLEDIQSIQTDEGNPNDCAKDPHDVTHSVDALRYMCINRVMYSIKPKEKVIDLDYLEEEEEQKQEYDEYMLGTGEISDSYMAC